MQISFTNSRAARGPGARTVARATGVTGTPLLVYQGLGPGVVGATTSQGPD